MCVHLSHVHILSVSTEVLISPLAPALKHAGHHPLPRPPRPRNLKASKPTADEEALPDLFHALKKGGVRLDDLKVHIYIRPPLLYFQA